MRVWLVSWDYRWFIGVRYHWSVLNVDMFGCFGWTGFTEYARKVSEARGYD